MSESSNTVRASKLALSAVLALLWCATTGAGAALACDEANVRIATTPALPTAPELAVDSQKRTANIPPKVDVMAIGDSITNGWPIDSLQSVFRGEKVYNFGIHGDHTQNVLWRLSRPEAGKVRPSTVTLLIGTNNLSTAMPACAIVAGTKAIIEKIDELWGRPKILFFGMLPRGDAFSFRNADRNAVNKSIEELLRARGNALTINIDNEISCGSKQPCANYASDNLHLSAAGYAVLQSAAARAVAEAKRR
ncbi:GDSL-type esterase/lipase family protein [Methylorubrum populi]|uniref:GDSL-type esterase/lipase family protein n=1 Tax=Methylorubrum populi TaxID=223967 RepID=UPI001646741A|nr:GDSL-type esterase/lipase family protein [Methylorubrum populi]